MDYIKELNLTADTIFGMFVWFIILIAILGFFYALFRGLFAWSDARAKGRMVYSEITWERLSNLRRQKDRVINSYFNKEITKPDYDQQLFILEAQIEDAYRDWVWAGDPNKRSPESEKYLKEKYK